MFQGIIGGLVEEPAAIDQRRCSNQTRNPVKHVAGRGIGAGPDRNRQQHDVDGGETAKANRTDQLVAQFIRTVLKGRKQVRFIPRRRDRLRKDCRIGHDAIQFLFPDDGYALG
ncbi:hypothetical protein D3C80_1902160 [compost metagenome]